MTWKNRKRLAMVRIQLRKTLKYLLHVGFTRRSKVRFAPTYFCLRQKISHPPAPLLLLFRKKSRSACLFGCKRPHNGLAVATNFLRGFNSHLPKAKNIFFIVLRQKAQSASGFCRLQAFSFFCALGIFP